MNSIQGLELRIKKIEERNRNVEANKAWETSPVRRVLIALLTYFIIGSYLAFILQISNPWFHALVPTVGFLLSTLTLEIFKQFWIKYLYHS